MLVKLLLIFLITLASTANADQDDHRITEMWNFYQPNSEKLTTLLGTWKNLMRLCAKKGLVSPDWNCQERQGSQDLLENLIKKIDALESRIVALEASSSYLPAAEDQSLTTTRTSRQKEASNTEINALPAAKARSSLNGNREESLFLSTTTSEAETTAAPEPPTDNASWKPSYHHCPPDYHPVGDTCYAVSFYVAAAFQEAAQQCKSQSKGHLVAFEQIDELQRLKHFLQMHVVANIHPYEAVSFWIGATTASQPDVARYHKICEYEQADMQLDSEDQCYAITWNAPRNCSFDLEAAHCGRSLRYICEAEPL